MGAMCSVGRLNSFGSRMLAAWLAVGLFIAAGSAAGAEKVLFFYPLDTDAEAQVTPEESKRASEFLLVNLSRSAQATVYDYAPDSPHVTVAVLENRLPREEIAAQLASRKPFRPDPATACRYALALKMTAAILGKVTRVNGEIALKLTVIDAGVRRGGEILVTAEGAPAVERAPLMVFQALKDLRAGAGVGEEYPAEGPGPQPPRAPGDANPPRPENGGPSPGNAEQAPPPSAFRVSSVPKAQANYEEAMALKDEDLDAAIVKLELACQQDLDSVRLRVELAKLYVDAARKHDAVAILREALGIDAADVEARVLFGQLRGDDAGVTAPPTASIEELHRLKLMHPQNVDIILQLAGQYEKVENWSRALREYREAAAIRPADPDIQLSIGRMAEKCHLDEEAERAYLQTANWQRDNPLPKQLLAAFYSRRGRHAEALDQYAAAAALREEPVAYTAQEYLAFVEALDAGFAELLKVTGQLQVAAQDVISRRGSQQTITREELYEQAIAAEQRLRDFAALLAKTIPPDTQRERHVGMRLASKLLVLAGAELVGAIDANSNALLTRSIESRNQAIDEANLAVKKAAATR